MPRFFSVTNTPLATSRRTPTCTSRFNHPIVSKNKVNPNRSALHPRIPPFPRHSTTPPSSTFSAYESDAEQPPIKQSTSSHTNESWSKKVLQLPLEVASTLSKEDAHYLEKSGRRRWWSRRSFPRVPIDSLEDAHLNPPSLSLWQKVAPLGAIFFAASFNLTILQTLKDSVLVTAAGAEVLPFIASLIVLPASLTFFMFYGRLVESLPSRTIFYIAVAPLVLFYAFFATVLYPAHPMLHPTGLVDSMLAIGLPVGLQGLVKVAEYWTFSLFYCFAELWGSVVISVLFWSLANEVVTVDEAKSVYPLMGISANVALVLAGTYVKHVSHVIAAGSTQSMLYYLVGAILGMTLTMYAAKAALDRWVIGPYCSLDPSTGSKPSPRKKKKGSLSESLAVIRGSPKISNLAILVVSYGISHRLFEFAWKGAVRVLYSTPQQYQSVLADVSIATGWATISFMLLGKFVFQYVGWSAAAMATPIAMFLSGGAFFALSLAANQGISVFGMNPSTMAFAGVAAGAVTQVFARSSKFSLFDPAKEMVYFAKDTTQDEKSKGKAAVDLIGSQIGKSGGAWMTQALLLLTGSIAASLPVIATAFTCVIVSWLHAVMRLGWQLKKSEEDDKVKESLVSAHGTENGKEENGPSMVDAGMSTPVSVQAA